MIDFTLTQAASSRRGRRSTGSAASVIRPECLKWDREHGVPHDFLRNLAMLATNLGSLATHGPGASDDEATRRRPRSEEEQRRT